jgi:hypothetical protein
MAMLRTCESQQVNGETDNGAFGKVPGPAGAHGGQVIRHYQAHGATPAIAQLEQLQRIAKSIDLALAETRIDHHAEQTRRTDRAVFAQGFPVGMAR